MNEEQLIRKEEQLAERLARIADLEAQVLKKKKRSKKRKRRKSRCSFALPPRSGMISPSGRRMISAPSTARSNIS